MATEPRIESRSQFKDDPEGLAKRWEAEFAASNDDLKAWWKDGEKVVKEYLGEKSEDYRKRLNLFHADVTNKEAQLYGNIPKARCRRRFADANDDVARVSAEILERILNTDIQRDSDTFISATKNALSDWTKPGLGAIRMRYVVDWRKEPGKPAITDECACTRDDPTYGIPKPKCPDCNGTGDVEIAPAVPPQDVKDHEDVETDYVYWKNIRYSPARTWDDVRWVAFMAEMPKDEVVERFGEEFKNVPLHNNNKGKDDEKVKDAWARAEVWEIHSREDRKRYWFVEGYDRILDVKDDALELPNFFPCPRPLFANVTTTKLVPRPTYFLVEDLYAEAHELTQRIRSIVKSIKVAGVFDAVNPDLKRLLHESCENELIPATNFAALSEKGGVAGSIQFLPIKEMVEAVIQLVQQRNIVKADIYEITGSSDISRGQAANQATATEQRIKARFMGTRIQADQLAFAEFISEALRIRAHIIATQFDPETIKTRSNIANSADPELVDQAIALIKSDVSQYRIEVDADALAMTDYDAVRQERTEFLQAMTMYLEQVGKIGMAAPPAVPYLLELGKHALAGFRGASTLEGVFDKMIDAAKQPQPPKPDPGAQAEQMRAQADMQKTGMDLKVAQAKHGMDMQKMQAEMVRDQAKARNEIAVASARPPLPPMPAGM